jgi:hypothetical protein
MNDKDQENVEVTTPDEQSGILVEARLKISDPETSEVFVEGRA